MIGRLVTLCEKIRKMTSVLQLVNGSLTQIDVSANGQHVVAVNKGEEIFHALHANKGAWSKLPGSLVVVAAANEMCFGVNKGGNVYRGDYQGNWTQLLGNLIFISCSADGKTVWGINGQNQIYRLVGKDWQLVDGALKQLSVSHDGRWIVGTNSADDIYRRPTDLSSGWEKIPGNLRYVSTYDGSIMAGVNAGGQIFCSGF